MTITCTLHPLLMAVALVAFQLVGKSHATNGFKQLQEMDGTETDTWRLFIGLNGVKYLPNMLVSVKFNAAGTEVVAYKVEDATNYDFIKMTDHQKGVWDYYKSGYDIKTPLGWDVPELKLEDGKHVHGFVCAKPEH